MLDFCCLLPDGRLGNDPPQFASAGRLPPFGAGAGAGVGFVAEGAGVMVRRCWSFSACFLLQARHSAWSLLGGCWDAELGGSWDAELAELLVKPV